MTFEHFKETFDREVKNEVKWDYFGGFFCILSGVTLIILTQLELLKYSATNVFHYTGSALIIILGITVLYWIRIRYRISSFDKDCSDDQLEKGITLIKERYNMDVLKNQERSYSFFYKPGSWTAWTEVNLYYDNAKVYINARPVSGGGNIDFGFGKRIEKKLMREIGLAASNPPGQI